jgi:hypothetical protein
MTKIATIRTSAVAAAALLMFGAVSGANAAVLFHNTTDRPIIFGITCGGQAFDRWTVAPYDSKSIYCTNGLYPALVEIRTNRGDHDEVVRALVRDGALYDLYYDRDGDVNIV